VDVVLNLSPAYPDVPLVPDVPPKVSMLSLSVQS